MENSTYKEFSMNRYTISIIVLNLIVLSNLSYAESNQTEEEKAKSTKQLIIKDAPMFLLPKSEQIEPSLKSETITLNEINKILKEVEKRTIQEEIELENFEERVKIYQKKIEEIKRTNE